MNVKNAIVIGEGFIGIEIAENLVHRGINVTLVEEAPNILAPFDLEISEPLEMENSLEKTNSQVNEKNGQTIVVFSGDLDKAIASFIIVNGAVAIDNGVEIVAYTMSIDVMEIKEEELIDGVGAKLGGVGYYLGEA